MKANVESLLLGDVQGSGPSEWRQDGLFSFCYSLLFRCRMTSSPLSDEKALARRRLGAIGTGLSLFPCPRAGYLTMFESTDKVTAVYKEFRKFDRLLSKLVRGSLKKGTSPPHHPGPSGVNSGCQSRAERSWLWRV